MRVVRKSAHRHGPSTRRSNLSLEASEALSLDDLEVHFRAIQCDDVIGLLHRQDVEDTDEVVCQIAVGNRDAGNEGDALLGIRAAVLGHLARVGVRDSVEVPAAICVVEVLAPWCNPTQEATRRRHSTEL